MKDVSEIRTNFLLFPVAPKCKEVNFKIMNHIYPAKEFLRVRFNVEESNVCQISKLEKRLNICFFSVIWSTHSGIMPSAGCNKNTCKTDNVVGSC